MNEMAINKSIENVSLFTDNLNSYHRNINATLARINQSTSGLDSVDMAKSLIQLDSLLKGANQIVQTINSGNGSLGKLINSDSIHNSLVATSNELNKVLLDLKKYPEKYIPVPFTKGQRKKAKTASKADSDIWD
jgi:phospholipid/cholesterol/gamma-HCH transport system substrate-binding protein